MRAVVLAAGTHADEMGVPYCVTVDFESLEDGCVTVRNRDTMQQERVKITDLTFA